MRELRGTGSGSRRYGPGVRGRGGGVRGRGPGVGGDGAQLVRMTPVAYEVSQTGREKDWARAGP